MRTSCWTISIDLGGEFVIFRHELICVTANYLKHFFQGRYIVSIQGNPRSKSLDPNGQASDVERFGRLLNRLLRALIVKSEEECKGNGARMV